MGHGSSAKQCLPILALHLELGGIQTPEYSQKRSLVFYTCGDLRAVRQGMNSLPHSESPRSRGLQS
ncbi:MAG: hypothetical protein ACRC62_09130 [Microcoleus sp.]